MQLNADSARKVVFKKKIEIQVKVLPMKKAGVFPASHLPQVSLVLLDPNQLTFVESCTALNNLSLAG